MKAKVENKDEQLYLKPTRDRILRLLLGITLLAIGCAIGFHAFGVPDQGGVTLGALIALLGGFLALSI